MLREPANVLAVATAKKIIAPDRVVFVIDEILSDERAELLTEGPREERTAWIEPTSNATPAARSWVVRMSPETAASVRLGETYIIGISRFLRGRFPIPKWQLDPEGYRLIDVQAVGEALFAASPDLEFLLTLPANPDDLAPRQSIDRILALLSDQPLTTRRAAVLELCFQPQLGELLTPGEIGRLQSMIEDEDEDPVIRDYLLQAAALFAPINKPDWVAATCRSVLRGAALDVQLGSTTATFQHTALRTLKERGNANDVTLVARLLRSASPGVTLSALQTMEALDLRQALALARAALESEGLPEQSQRYLESFVRRAELRVGTVPPT